MVAPKAQKRTSMTARTQLPGALNAVGAQLFATLLENISRPVFFKDCQSVFVSVNPAFAAEFSLTPADFTGKTDFDFFPPELAEQYQAHDRNVLLGQTEEGSEPALMGIKVDKVPVTDENGKVIGLLGIFQESAESNRASEELRRSEQEFRKVWEGSLDGMRLTDEHGITLQVNDAYARMVGKPASELIGKPFSVIYEIEQQEQMLTRHKERFAVRGVQAIFERELSLWHGGKVWFELSNSFLEVTGQPTHLLSIFRDVTERKVAEEKVLEFSARLERSNRELEDFAYVASHDLQEPLRKVAVFADRLKTKFGTALEGEGIDYLERMQKATKRMQTLITELLSFSRVTTKSQPFVPVDLSKIVHDVLADLETRIEQVGGKIEVGSLPIIEAEPLQMRQLFQNLIGNALKFHRPDVKPIVRIEGTILQDKIRREQTDQASRSMLRIAVSDNGIGFDEKYNDKIFQVFQRLHGRDVYEGTGMGLAITRKITEHHSGEIFAKSKPGEGATFLVTLPLKQRKISR